MKPKYCIVCGDIPKSGGGHAKDCPIGQREAERVKGGFEDVLNDISKAADGDEIDFEKIWSGGFDDLFDLGG